MLYQTGWGTTSRVSYTADGMSHVHKATGHFKGDTKSVPKPGLLQVVSAVPTKGRSRVRNLDLQWPKILVVYLSPSTVSCKIIHLQLCSFPYPVPMHAGSEWVPAACISSHYDTFFFFQQKAILCSAIMMLQRFSVVPVPHTRSWPSSTLQENSSV